MYRRWWYTMLKIINNIIIILKRLNRWPWNQRFETVLGLLLLMNNNGHSVLNFIYIFFLTQFHKELIDFIIYNCVLRGVFRQYLKTHDGIVQLYVLILWLAYVINIGHLCGDDVIHLRLFAFPFYNHHAENV